MADIPTGIAQFMVDVGLMDVILPFMLIFTILFAILQKTKVLGSVDGEPKRNINAMLAFVVSFFFIASLARVEILTTIVQKLALVLVAAIALMLIVGLWGKEVGWLKYSWLYVILFIIVLLIFGTSLKWFTLDDLGVLGEWLFHPITVAALVFILIMWLLIREPGKIKILKEKPEEKPGAPEERPSRPEERPAEGKPRLVKEIPKEDLYGGEGRTVWKE